MEEHKNPFLEAEDYAAPYKKNAEELRNRPEIIEFDRLCYELFEMNPQGKRFIDLVKERYLLPALANPGSHTYQIDVIFWDGFKEFGRVLINSLRSHQQRIAAGTK